MKLWTYLLIFVLIFVLIYIYINQYAVKEGYLANYSNSKNINTLSEMRSFLEEAYAVYNPNVVFPGTQNISNTMCYQISILGTYLPHILGGIQNKSMEDLFQTYGGASQPTQPMGITTTTPPVPILASSQDYITLLQLCIASKNIEPFSTGKFPLWSQDISGNETINIDVCIKPTDENVQAITYATELYNIIFNCLEYFHNQVSNGTKPVSGDTQDTTDIQTKIQSIPSNSFFAPYTAVSLNSPYFYTTTGNPITQSYPPSDLLHYTTNGTITVYRDATIKYMIVGGGGGGGNTGNEHQEGGGGGGGGQVITGTATLNKGKVYNITIGEGGVSRGNGGNSSISTIATASGGGGGGWGEGISGVGNGGGSQGVSRNRPGGIGMKGCYNGGAALNRGNGSGGGGAGGNGFNSDVKYGEGGPGIQWSIMPDLGYFGAGGGGGGSDRYSTSRTAFGKGGSNSGGDGQPKAMTGLSAGGYGNGGGGAGSSGASGGAGSSGCVFILIE